MSDFRGLVVATYLYADTVITFQSSYTTCVMTKSTQLISRKSCWRALGFQIHTKTPLTPCSDSVISELFYSAAFDKTAFNTNDKGIFLAYETIGKERAKVRATILIHHVVWLVQKWNVAVGHEAIMFEQIRQKT